MMEPGPSHGAWWEDESSTDDLKHVRYRLDIMRKFFPVRTAEHWSRLPREAGLSLFLGVFKTCLETALSNLG